MLGEGALPEKAIVAQAAAGVKGYFIRFGLIQVHLHKPRYRRPDETLEQYWD